MGSVKTVAIVGGIALAGGLIYSIAYYSAKRANVKASLENTMTGDVERIAANPDNFINPSIRTGVVNQGEAPTLATLVSSGDIHTSAYVYRANRPTFEEGSPRV